jgi:hypothetical protein
MPDGKLRGDEVPSRDHERGGLEREASAWSEGGGGDPCNGRGGDRG